MTRAVSLTIVAIAIMIAVVAQLRTNERSDELIATRIKVRMFEEHCKLVARELEFDLRTLNHPNDGRYAIDAEIQLDFERVRICVPSESMPTGTGDALFCITKNDDACRRDAISKWLDAMPKEFR